MDVELIRALVEMLDGSELTELEVENEGLKVRLRKGGDTVEQVVAVPTMAPPPMPMPMAMQMPMSAPAPAAAAASDPAVVAGSKPLAANQKDICSPLVGTFYRSPNPDSPVFVERGDQVDEDTVLCLVEAMKVFNEIKAECSGVIDEILVDNGEAVEFNQPMFRIRLAG